MRDNFKSSFGVLVAMAGSAIGLGNLWRFPYLMGTNGGAAFIIIYLVLVFLLCLPIMMSEFVVGRRSQVNAVKAFKVLSPKGHWGLVGVLGVLASVALISFYCVVGGWTIDYLVHAVSFTLPEQGSSEGFFAAAVSTPGRTILYTYIFLALTSLVLLAGIKDGIERYTKVMMPLLFLTIIIIAIRSVTLPGAGAGLEFLYKPDFSKVTGNTFLNALGQAFFSLSIGCATILTYGSYVKKQEKIVKLSSLTAISDTFFAILAGLAIMPAVFAFGISPSEGPGLLFVVLPDIFDQIAAGGVIAILFFFVLFIAAITSSISLLEVSVTYLIEACRMKRRMAVLLSSAVCLVLCTLCALSGSVLSDVHILGKTFFDFFDMISANLLMPLCGLFIVIFVGWKLGRKDFVDELSNGGTLPNKRLYNAIFYLVRYVAPLVIAVIMIFGWL